MHIHSQSSWRRNGTKRKKYRQQPPLILMTTGERGAVGEPLFKGDPSSAEHALASGGLRDKAERSSSLLQPVRRGRGPLKLRGLALCCETAPSSRWTRWHLQGTTPLAVHPISARFPSLWAPRGQIPHRHGPTRRHVGRQVYGGAASPPRPGLRLALGRVAGRARGLCKKY